MTGWSKKHLLGLESLTAKEISTILELAAHYKPLAMRQSKENQELKGTAVLLLFFEPSTRTSTSFTIAARRLGAEVIGIAKTASSAQKGETLKDTARNIEAMGIDVVVIRHNCSGAPAFLSRCLSAGVINAGDGAHEHPTQALLDLFTIRQVKGRIEGLTVAIVGDISHSRVARSNIWGLNKLGARVIVVGPPTLIPAGIEDLGVEVAHSLDQVIGRCDVVNVLRIQRERQGAAYFPSVSEYSRLFGLNADRLRHAPSDILVMHPGPINRGVEMTPEVADGLSSHILEQVSNGVAVRMAVLSLINRSVPRSGVHSSAAANDASDA